MTQQAIISRILERREFTNKDGRQRLSFNLEFKVAYTTRNGQIGYDFYQGQWLADNTPEAEAQVKALVGKTVQVVAYFNLRSYQDKNGNTRYSQDCYIAEMYQNV